MRREHVRPLVAFVLVTVTCAVIVLHGLMAGALDLWRHTPTSDDHVTAPVTTHAVHGSAPTARVSTTATPRATRTSPVVRAAPSRPAPTTPPRVSASSPDAARPRAGQPTPAPAVVRALDDVTPVVSAAEDLVPDVGTAASRTVGAVEPLTR